jgi:hypothetical protein
VIHRDLKPSNVMLTAGGVKLLDFGLAKLKDIDDEGALAGSTQSLLLTEQGAVLGTVPYMAPEQIEAREADARTDVFALGVILYEMVSGRPPFEGRSAASVMAAILTHDPQPLSASQPDVPAGVERVIGKCLAKNPDERWQSAADLMAALLWSREDNAARKAPAGRDGRPRVTRRLLAAAAVVAVAATAIWVIKVRGRGSTPPAAPHFMPITFRTGTVSGARFAPDGETVIYSAAWGGNPYALFMTRRGSPESLPLNIPDAKLLSVSSNGDLSLLRGSQEAVRVLAPPRTGTLARVAMTGGAPRDLLDDVVAADSTSGGDVAVVRRDRVEFPLGTTIHGPNQFRYVRIALVRSWRSSKGGKSSFSTAPERRQRSLPGGGTW